MRPILTDIVSPQCVEWMDHFGTCGPGGRDVTHRVGKFVET
ncbi:MAG: hypothetical protein ACYCPM_02840 [Acidobacteriaceae bacterium]